MNYDLKERGLLSDEKNKQRKSKTMKPFKIGDKDNSMLRSDIDIDEDPN